MPLNDDLEINIIADSDQARAEISKTDKAVDQSAKKQVAASKKVKKGKGLEEQATDENTKAVREFEKALNKVQKQERTFGLRGAERIKARREEFVRLARAAGKSEQEISKLTRSFDVLEKRVDRSGSRRRRDASFGGIIPGTGFGRGILGGVFGFAALGGANLLGQSLRTVTVEAVKTEARAEQLAISLDVLAQRTGQSRQQMLAAETQLRSMQLTQIQARDAIQLFTRSGADQAEVMELVGLAFDAAARRGLTLDDALRRLADATAKAEPELLDELGIVIKLGQVFDAYAKKIGVANADTLTAAQRSRALVEALVAQAAQGGESAAAAGTLSDQLLRVAQQQKLLGEEFGRTARGPGEVAVSLYSRFLTVVTRLVKQMREIPTLNREIRREAQALADVRALGTLDPSLSGPRRDLDPDRARRLEQLAGRAMENLTSGFSQELSEAAARRLGAGLLPELPNEEDRKRAEEAREEVAKRRRALEERTAKALLQAQTETAGAVAKVQLQRQKELELVRKTADEVRKINDEAKRSSQGDIRSLLDEATGFSKAVSQINEAARVRAEAALRSLRKIAGIAGQQVFAQVKAEQSAILEATTRDFQDSLDTRITLQEQFVREQLTIEKEQIDLIEQRRLQSLDAVSRRDVAGLVATEARKSQIQQAAVNQRLDIERRAIQLEAELAAAANDRRIGEIEQFHARQLEIAERRINLEAEREIAANKGTLDEIERARNERLNLVRQRVRSEADIEISANKKLVDQLAEFRDLRLTSLAAKRTEQITAIQERAQRRQTKAIIDENTRIFDSLKRSAEGLFDELLTGTKGFSDALVRILKTALLTPIKEIVSTTVAQLLLPIAQSHRGIFRAGRGFAGAGAGPGLLSLVGGLGSVSRPGAPGGTVGIAGPVGLTLGSRVGLSSRSGAFNVPGLAGAGGPLAGLGGFAALRDLFGLGSSIGTGAGSATTFGAATLPQLLKSFLTSPGALGVGGASLLGLGLTRQGAGSRIGLSAAGGALIGTAIAPGIGTAIGAAAGGIAGLVRGLFKSASRKIRERIKSSFGVDISDSNVLNNITQIVKSQFGGNIDAGIQSPAVRDIIELFAASTGQSFSGFSQIRPTPLLLVQRQGALGQRSSFRLGQQVALQSPLPNVSPSGQTMVIQLDPDATREVLNGRAADAIVQNPRAVQRSSLEASSQNVGRRQGAALALEPKAIVPA